MTNDQINTAIARKLGWTDIEKHPFGQSIGRKKVGGLMELIPDFCNSLDACRFAEDALDAREAMTYADILCDEVSNGDPDPHVVGLILIRSEQRALALCKTWGLEP